MHYLSTLCTFTSDTDTDVSGANKKKLPPPPWLLAKSSAQFDQQFDTANGVKCVVIHTAVWALTKYPIKCWHYMIGSPITGW